jgi:hypothetical protein
LAAGSIQAMRVPTVVDTDQQQLGTIKVTIPAGAILNGDVLIVKLPTDWEFGAPFNPVVEVADTANANELVVPVNYQNTGNAAADLNGLSAANITLAVIGDDEIRLTAAANQSTTNDFVFYIYLGDVDVEEGTDGDCVVSFEGPSNTGFPLGNVVVARTASAGKVTLSASGTDTSNNAFSFDLRITEEVAKSLKLGTDAVKLVLPDGYEWDAANAVTDANMAGIWGERIQYDVTVNDDELVINFDGVHSGVALVDDDPVTPGTQPRDTNVASAWEIPLSFTVIDESRVSSGDVLVQVKGKSTLSPSELKVGTYGEYGVTISAKSTPEVFAGQIEQEIGDIVIKEGIGESLVDGRYITLSLPSYAKWTQIDTPVSNNGITLTFAGNAGSEGNVLKYTIANPASGNSAAELKLEDLEVALDVAAPGDLVVTLGGNAGFTGEVTVAKINMPVSIKAEGQDEVKIGVANQKIADLVITEAVAGAIKDRIAGAQQSIVLKVPSGVEFAKNPTVKVESGDLKLDLTQVRRVKAVGAAQPTDYYQYLVIPVDNDSNTASTIRISDLYVTVDRTVPEGNLLVALVGGAVLASNNAYAGSTPLGAAGYRVGPNGMFPQTAAIGAAAPAKVVTPAPGDKGNSASFYIGSTIMNVNGANIIMDAAPYIKAGRTYVPVRYLGDALGATTAWDEATKTVTVTKGDKTVVLVIGSKVAKVNGADVQMDVAPEITGVGRTMLPARWVAEGLGYQVGWNAALQQVVIQ